MKFRTPSKSAVAAAAIVVGFAAQASAQELHVMASNGMKAVIEGLRPEFERTSGKKLTIDYGTTTVLKKQVADGKAFDVAIFTSDAVDDLVKSGKISAATRTGLARCGIGVGIKKGAAKPDLKNAESFKQTLLKAKSITYAQDGASRQFIEKTEDKFGIRQAMQAKTMMVPGSGAATSMVADGKAEMVLTLVSEIVGVPGIELAGPFPSEVQNYVSFAAGTSPASKNADAGKAWIKFLTGPAAAPALKQNGMEAAK